MRTTLDIDEDVLDVCKTRARANHTSAGKELSTLARDGLHGERRSQAMRSGLLVFEPRPGRQITSQAVETALHDWP